MKSAARRPALLLLALGVAAGWGCSKPVPKRFPVGGVVVNGTQPVARVTISFSADLSKGGPTLDAYGSTDGEGRFTLQTVSHGQGLPAGHYKVVLTTDGPSRRLIPDKLTALLTTTLEVDVPEGGVQDLKLDLAKYR
jgi:hypothetical protein